MQRLNYRVPCVPVNLFDPGQRSIAGAEAIREPWTDIVVHEEKHQAATCWYWVVSHIHHFMSNVPNMCIRFLQYKIKTFNIFIIFYKNKSNFKMPCYMYMNFLFNSLIGGFIILLAWWPVMQGTWHMTMAQYTVKSLKALLEDPGMLIYEVLWWVFVCW